jgi:Cd2+/Zn2+-exporting ATPase
MDLQNALTELGFTEYEAKVYLALVADYPATGYQISKKSGVPRSMVYETLSRLSARGAVMESVEGRSTRYRPLPPEVLLDHHEHEYRRRLSDLREGLHSLYTASEEESLWTITGRSAVLGYAEQMLGKAQREVSLVLADDDLDSLQPALEALCERGVMVSALLTGERTLACGQVLRHPPLESELQELGSTLLIAVDDREVLIASRNGEMSGTVTRSPNLVYIARQFVWMELFTQRIYAQLGPELLERLDPADRRIFESLDE